MKQGYFITGTDTGVGKTLVSAGMMALLKSRGLRVGGMKPVAAGAQQTKSGLRNEDAELLLSMASVKTDYSLVNPYLFEPPIAPHIAAEETAQTISLEIIKDSFDQLSQQADCVVVEGAGGWLVPLNDQLSMANLAQQLGLPVILVVGLKLGCINHALLTAEKIMADGCVLAGWVANQIDPDMQCVQENIQSIQKRIPSELLGFIPYQSTVKPDEVAQFITLKD
ncbi:MAG: dethiobiotin synthase [Gammaproteobacteria bacterium]|nr:dethiobiotin synthase [Gammaproteobacteria bacterium]MDH5594602.1 dethiobiotin synthase [Gammaproteobacteria bacterium]MDH5613553.1 dethiobiotin synthase [Gammaproteobacteria bacterium]